MDGAEQLLLAWSINVEDPFGGSLCQRGLDEEPDRSRDEAQEARHEPEPPFDSWSQDFRVNPARLRDSLAASAMDS